MNCKEENGKSLKIIVLLDYFIIKDSRKLTFYVQIGMEIVLFS